MKQISFQGTPISLQHSGDFLLWIDPLYLQQIKDQIVISEIESAPNLSTYLAQTKKSLFPDGSDSIFTLQHTTSPNELTLHPKHIRKRRNQILSNNNVTFDIDSGLLLIISSEVWLEFVASFTYDELVDSILDGEYETPPYRYLQRLCDQLGNKFGLICAPGVNSGFDFEGSGTYYIDLQ